MGNLHESTVGTMLNGLFNRTNYIRAGGPQPQGPITYGSKPNGFFSTTNYARTNTPAVTQPQPQPQSIAEVGIRGVRPGAIQIGQGVTKDSVINLKNTINNNLQNKVQVNGTLDYNTLAILYNHYSAKPDTQQVADSIKGIYIGSKPADADTISIATTLLGGTIQQPKAATPPTVQQSVQGQPQNQLGKIITRIDKDLEPTAILKVTELQSLVWDLLGTKAKAELFANDKNKFVDGKLGTWTLGTLNSVFKDKKFNNQALAQQADDIRLGKYKLNLTMIESWIAELKKSPIQGVIKDQTLTIEQSSQSEDNSNSSLWAAAGLVPDSTGNISAGTIQEAISCGIRNIPTLAGNIVKTMSSL